MEVWIHRCADCGHGCDLAAVPKGRYRCVDYNHTGGAAAPLIPLSLDLMLMVVNLAITK